MRRYTLALIVLGSTIAATNCAHALRTDVSRQSLVSAVSATARPIRGEDGDYNALLEMIGDNRFVLLGESTHGTEEFYRERARITRRLIAEKGFTVVAVEADWADAYDVNEVIHQEAPGTPETVAATFERFPSWTWNNAQARELFAWLRDWNGSEKGREQPVGFYGLDLYSVPESARRVIAFLQTVDPAAAARASERYRCFDRLEVEGLIEYGRRVVSGERRSCAEPAAAEFIEMSERMNSAPEGHQPGDEALVSAWQNARVVMNGEAYYRLLNTGGIDSWNLRDRHMADTLDALSQHLDAGASHPAKVIVWAHNSHLGDARTTDRTDEGEWNVGQLMRQRHDGQSVLVGFTTYAGTVRAATWWGGGAKVEQLKPANSGSFASLFHETGVPAFMLDLRDNAATRQLLEGRRLERFVGLVYDPSSERLKHYFKVNLANEFDAVIHIDHTTALEVSATAAPANAAISRGLAR